MKLCLLYLDLEVSGQKHITKRWRLKKPFIFCQHFTAWACKTPYATTYMWIRIWRCIFVRFCVCVNMWVVSVKWYVCMWCVCMYVSVFLCSLECDCTACVPLKIAYLEANSVRRRNTISRSDEKWAVHPTLLLRGGNFGTCISLYRLRLQ